MLSLFQITLFHCSYSQIKFLFVKLSKPHYTRVTLLTTTKCNLTEISNFTKEHFHNRCLQEPICLFLHPFSISLYALVDKQPILIFTHKGIFSQTAKGNTCRRYSQKKKKNMWKKIKNGKTVKQ